MRKFVLLLVGTAILCVPAVSAAATPTPARLATQTCKSIRAGETRATFKLAYHSFAGCLKAQKSDSKQDVTNAAKTCKAERSADPAAFRTKYGTNRGNANGAGANAFGKCVSALAKQNAHRDASSEIAAAKTCKGMKADPPTFQAAYGTGKNAFGKCVAAQSKASNS
ncbi:MAG TPA: hypothetical protein VFL58_02175 [Gaiellaceae bacterium]|nr:hypothetical protein [Gaiellaceae bacterium]